jgi:hypothetical protein
MNLHQPTIRVVVAATLASALAACGAGQGMSGNSIAPVAAHAARTPLLIRDAASDNWATVGVKVLTITLTQQGGGTVSVYAPATPAMVNLAQLDEIADLMNGAIPAGTYTGATITLAANPGDVSLVVGSDPDSNLGTPGTAIPSSQISINGVSGATGAQTVAINLTFASPITVSSGGSTPVEIDFNLGHPAFVISHSVVNGATVYAVSFSGGVVSQHHVAHVTDIVLRHLYGSVASVATDNSALTLNRETPTLPIVSPETAVQTGDTETITADATYGTLYYDLDATPVTAVTIKDFSSVATTLPSRQTRIQARYQPDGTLVATRIFVSNTFATVWNSPEGHVLHVDPTAATIDISTETGGRQTLTIDSNTTFVLPNQPAGSSLGTGPSFLSNIVRGFKVHVTPDSTTPTLAKIVEIETAVFNGRIANANSTGFDVQSTFGRHQDRYTKTLPYIAATTANGTDSSGNAITGFDYFEFAYPTQVVSGPNAVTNFVAAVGGSVGFGGSATTIYARGETHAVWGDPSNATGWSAPWVSLTPSPVPFAFVANPIVNGQFTITVPGGTTAVTVDLDSKVGEATLVYSVDRAQDDHISLTPQDITTSSGLAAVTAALTAGAPVKITGIPQADGTLKAYTVMYFTGQQPSDAN